MGLQLCGSAGCSVYPPSPHRRTPRHCKQEVRVPGTWIVEGGPTLLSHVGGGQDRIVQPVLLHHPHFE